MYLFQHIMHWTASYFEIHRSILLCHRNSNSFTTLGCEKEIRMMSTQIHNCVRVNLLFLQRISNAFRFGGRRVQPDARTYRCRHSWFSSPLPSQANTTYGLFCYFLLFSPECLDVGCHDSIPPPLFCVPARASTLQLLTVNLLPPFSSLLS